MNALQLQNIPIRIKIIIFNVLILLFGFCIGISSIYYCFYQNTEKDVGDAGKQLVSAQATILDMIWDHITQFSNIVYFDSAVQNTLKHIDRSEIQAEDLQTVQNSLASMILSSKYIYGAVLINNYYSSYKSVRQNNLVIDTAAIKKSDWYIQLQTSQGDVFFTHRSDGVINFPGYPDQNYITYIRTIPDMSTYDELAILMLIIDERTIQNLLYNFNMNPSYVFYIADTNGNFIIPPKQKMEDAVPIIQKTDNIVYRSISYNGRPAVCIQKPLGIQDWYIVGLLNIRAREELQSTYVAVIGVFVLVNTLITGIISLLLKYYVFSPLLRLQEHMQEIERGNFVPMQISEKGHNEILTLQRVNNHMIFSIKDLIEKIKIEEKIIAKNELDIIVAQLDPHFLYNTLDAACALCLMEDHIHCFKLLQSLGSFYRNSLNSGKDLVTVADEIDCIKNYITILNIRYDNRIQVHYDIPDTMRPLLMLKLLLQPLVENAVYHGIKERAGIGNILIQGVLNDKDMYFTIRDDGIGMDEKHIQMIMDGKIGEKRTGFGMYSLVQRISLYYGIEKPLTIESEIGLGTSITVYVKVLDEG